MPSRTLLARRPRLPIGPWIVLTASLSTPLAAAAQQPAQVDIHWDKVTTVSTSTPTLQVVVNPRLEPNDPLSVAAYHAVKSLGADYVRYVPWLPYPRLAVAELQPPTATKTSWDFSLIDPRTRDFLNATAGHPTVMNFSTTPTWLYETDKPITYPADPNQVDWNYTQGTELRDPTGKQLGDYYARLVSWYVNGGFTDELGAKHRSGYHYKFPVWEVLNEVESEHGMSPQQYTQRYDAIVSAIHKVSPDTKFMGLALAAPSSHPDFFEYFLNPAHHAPNTLPTYPFHAGDIFTLTPGDANIAKWAQNPLADGFVVQQVETDGHPVPGTKVCALEPDYMADSQQPGGTLTLLSQQLPDTWQVRWSGGNTLPPYMKQKDNFDANCGTTAVVLMTNDQLHALHDILAGISTSAPPAK